MQLTSCNNGCESIEVTQGFGYRFLFHSKNQLSVMEIILMGMTKAAFINELRHFRLFILFILTLSNLLRYTPCFRKKHPLMAIS